MTQQRPLIAVVDDDQAYIDLLVDLLQSQGYRCVWALTEGDAFPLILQELPDLIILDLRMNRPDSGLHILSQIRATPQTSHLPVLVCSADRRALRTYTAWLL